jgi:hypothetical protein
MDKLTYTFARMTALSLASKEGLRDITKIDTEFHDETCSFYVYGTMYDLDPETYDNGRAPMFVRVTNNKIDIVDGV